MIKLKYIDGFPFGDFHCQKIQTAEKSTYFKLLFFVRL